MGIPNPKHQALNKFKLPKLQIQNGIARTRDSGSFLRFGALNFALVWDLVLRISDLSENVNSENKD